MSGPHDEEILLSLRRISRAIDLHSRSLAARFELTAPQLVCLRQVVAGRAAAAGELARQVSLSQATVTGILDRLEARGLLERHRDPHDRRRQLLSPTQAGRRLAAAAPIPLQERFAARLAALPPADQQGIAQALARIVEMMEAEEISAQPVMAAGPLEEENGA